jgi:hypothetical protein
VARRALLLAALACLAAGCGVRNSKPFTAKATAACLRSHGFKAVSTEPGKVGFVAGFSANGGLVGTSPSGNRLTIAFDATPDDTASTEQAFREHAPKSLRPHLSDIMSASRNAVLVWTITPKPDDVDAVNRCLRS